MAMVCRLDPGKGDERRGEGRCIQQTNGKDSQDADLAPCWDLEFGEAVEGEKEDGEVGNYIDGGSSDKGGLQVDTTAFKHWVPDASAGHALKYRRG